MPNVIINEKDRTVFNVVTNDSDNIVYVPGIAVTGPSEPQLIRDYYTFLETYGANPNTSQQNGCSWEYATNLLIEGFPVLYHRITSYNNGADIVAGTAKKTISVTTSEVIEGETVTTTTDELVIASKYAGTVGNTYTVTFTLDWTAGTAGTLKYTAVQTITNADGTTSEIVLDNNVLICNIPETVTTEADLFALIADTIESVESDYIVFDIVSDTFALPTDWELGEYALEGGTNGDEDAIATALATDPTLTADLKDEDLYDIKFITSGGATAEKGSDMYKILVNLAEARNDCLAILDAPMGDIDLTTSTVQEHFSDIVSSYATACYPWVDFILRTPGPSKWMSPSFVFLFELAKSIKNGNPIWMPPAGVRRGLVPECNKLSHSITGAVADSWDTQYPHINPIRQIRNYGYAIYGQKTMYKVSTTGATKSAFEDLNVRLTANEIKRVLKYISVNLTFEGNNYNTWLEFYNQLDPYLSSLLANGALERYEIIMDETTTSQDDINNNIVRGVVRVMITRIAEEFNIDFVITNNSADFTESVV